MADSGEKMMLSSARIGEIAARELDRHVQDPEFRSVLKELVQQVEDAMRDGDLWILEVVKQLEELQVHQQNQFYGERADLLHKQSDRLKNEYANHNALLSKQKTDEDKMRVRQMVKKEHESTMAQISDERRQFDARMVKELEACVKYQQEILLDAHIPGIEETTETAAINLQKDILRFLLALHGEIHS